MNFFNYSERINPDQPDYLIAELVLNRPEKNNALNQVFIQQLIGQFKKINQNPKIGILLITHTGKNFCAGADLTEMATIKTLSPEQDLKICSELSDFFKILNTLDPIVITQIHGASYGGGLGLIACSDYVIASPDATSCFSEVKLGLIPATISPYILAKIGFSNSKKWLLSAERFDAQTALELNLIQIINQDPNELIHTLSQKSLRALIETKKLLNFLYFSEFYKHSELYSQPIQALSQARQHSDTHTRIQKFLNHDAKISKTR